MIKVEWEGSESSDRLRQYSWYDVRCAEEGSQFLELGVKKGGIFMPVAGGVLIVYEGHLGLAIADEQYFSDSDCSFIKVESKKFTIHPKFVTEEGS